MESGDEHKSCIYENDYVTCHSKGVTYTFITIYGLSLAFTLLNAYLYLWRLSKYRFMPFLLLYVGMIGMCCIVIGYYAECITPMSKVNSTESAWVYFMINMRLSCLISIIGYSSLIVDLLLMLRLMRKSQNKIKEAK